MSVRRKLEALEIDFSRFRYSDILNYKNGMILIFRNRENSDLEANGTLVGEALPGGREMYKFV